MMIQYFAQLYVLKKNQTIDYGTSYDMHYKGEDELKKITFLEPHSYFKFDSIDFFICSYIHELIIKLTDKKRHIGLFQCYHQTLLQLTKESSIEHKKTNIKIFSIPVFKNYWLWS